MSETINDLIIVIKDHNAMTCVQHTIQQLFKLKTLGYLKYFLGLEITQSKNGIYFS